MAVPFADGLVDDVPDYSLLVPLGYKPETEGHDVGRDGVVGIAGSGLVEKAPVVGFLEGEGGF